MSRLILRLLLRLPQGALSRLTGWLMHQPVPRPLRGIVVGGFARVVGIQTREAEHPPASYPSIGAYFVRRLKPGVRVWPDDSDLPTSPVDGIVGACGTLSGGRLLQAKGMDYSLSELLGDEDRAVSYADGFFITIYLSPRHYHRIHTPVGGAIQEARSIPGRLLPVHLTAVREIQDLFPRNERLVVHLTDTRETPVALVAVGAFNVGRISAAFEPGWETNGPGRPEDRREEVRHYSLPVMRGDELAAFHLGSTVVLAFGPEIQRRGLGLHSALTPGAPIALGEPLFQIGH